MTKEQLEKFLQERGATPDQINEIEKFFSHEVIEKYLIKVGIPTTEVIVDTSASKSRKKFSEQIEITESGGLSWSEIKHFL